MKNTITKILMTVFFTVMLPLITVELLLQKPGELISRIRLSYQIMLFVISFGRTQTSLPTAN